MCEEDFIVFVDETLSDSEIDDIVNEFVNNPSFRYG